MKKYHKTQFFLIKLSLIVLLPFSLFSSSVEAGVVTIYGQITNAQTPPVPIPNATIIYQTFPDSNNSGGGYQTVIADGSGNYSLTLPCGDYGQSNQGPSVVLSSGILDKGGLLSFYGCMPERQGRYQLNKSISDSALDDKGINAGDTCPGKSVGAPVNVTNGNMWIKQSDYITAGMGGKLELTRTYNSSTQSPGLFGYGWTSNYDTRLLTINSNLIQLKLGNGQVIIFGFLSNNTYIPATNDFYGQIVKNPDTTYTLSFKDGRVHNFNSGGRLLWQKDNNGNKTTLTYDTNGNLSGITDIFGRTLTVTTNSGYITQLNDSIGLVATYLYNPNGTMQSVSYPDGSKYKFEHTIINNLPYLATVKDALDNILETHLYDSQGRATTSEKQGGIEKYTLDYLHINDSVPYTTVTDALGRVTKYYFDKSRGHNVITKTEGNCNCGGAQEVTTFEYDNKLNLTKKTDGNSNVSTFSYDVRGNMLTSTNVPGTKTFTYNNFGEVLTATDQMNGITTVTYSTTGNPTQVKDALNNTTDFTYNANGQIQTVKDARNNTTTLTWTGANLTKKTDANLKETNFGYDARGRLQTVADALGFITTYQYDLSNRIKKVIYPDAKFEEYTYDLAGRRTQVRDALGNTTTFGYDAAYRLTTVTDALNHTTTIGYDLMSNRTSVTDALNKTTNYEYDNFDRLKKTIYPESTAGAIRLNEQLFYDLAGNLKKRTDTAGRDTLHDYDAANRLIKTTDANLQITQFEYNPRSQTTKLTDAIGQIYNFTYDPLGRQLSQTRSGATMSYQYDAAGNRTKRTDYAGRISDYVYDNLNRLTNINYVNQSGSNLSYGYDDLSRLTSATNNAGTVAFTYDSRNRIKTSTDVFNHTVEYGYDENGNRNLLKLDGAAHTTYAYDVANRLTTLTDEANQNFTFGYDNANRLATKTLPNNVVTTYNYDGMSRLKQLKHQSSSATLFDNQYGYNPASQISQITEMAQTKNFGYDNLDRLTSTTYTNPTQSNETYAFDTVGNRTSSVQSSTYGYQANNKLTSTATANYAYDANGNMISKADLVNTWQYAWDYENRMSSASNGVDSVSYNYDALGRRVKRTQGGDVTKFTYDGLDVVMDDDSVSGITKYQNGLGIDDKLELTNGVDAKYFLTDHLGSTVGLADSSGNISSSANYDSFGNSANNLTTRYQFTGREFDSFTGLHYYRARFYHANLGRFISEDPIGFAGGDVNLYAYVADDPVNYTDSSGLVSDKFPKEGKLPGTNIPYRMDMRQEPFPNMHVFWRDGNETVITYKGGWALDHGGKPTVPPPMSYRKILKPVTENFLDRVNAQLAGRMGGLINVLGLLDGFFIDYDRYRRAQDCGLSFEEQLRQDAGDSDYIITPFGVFPNTPMS